MESHLLEINLISAQALKPPAGVRRIQGYAVAWVDPAFKLRTRVDRIGGENPTWNDKFIFRVPASFLADDSPSAVAVEIYAAAGWILLPDPLLGTVRLLVGNLRLLSRRQDRGPAFDALGIRRPSGSFHGVLNVGAMLLRRVSLVVSRALAACPAVGCRDLIGEEGSKIRRIPAPQRGKDPAAGKDPALKEWNGEKRSSDRRDEDEEGEGEGEGADGGVVLCGPRFFAFPRRIHRSPSDQILKIPWAGESPGS